MTSSTDATTTLRQVEPVVTSAATDSGYRSTVLQAPAATLQSAGVTIPAGATVSVVQNSATLSYLVVPGTPDLLTADVQQGLATLESDSDAAASSIDAFAKLVIDSWRKSTLKSQLLSNPTAALAARGIAIPGGVSVQALEATSSIRVPQGGHDVPPEVVRRRFDVGMRHFLEVYRYQVDYWQLLDNGGVEPRLLEEGRAR